MHAAEETRPVALDSVDEGDVPERPVAAQHRREEVACELEQLLLRPRRRQIHMAQVPLDAELRVILPRRVAGVQRRDDSALAVARDEVHAGVHARA